MTNMKGTSNQAIPAVKEQVDRYDTYSYVALGAMQVGVVVLAIRLAF